MSDSLTDRRTFRTQKAYIECFNRTFREEVLDVYAFGDLEDHVAARSKKLQPPEPVPC